MHQASWVAFSQLLLLTMTMVATQGQLPVRDPQKPPPKGSAVIRGFVVDAESGVPLPRALVQVTGPSTGMNGVYTDGDGRFEFRELVAGTLYLNTTHTPYLPTTYGQQAPNMRGKPIELRVGEVVERIRIAMSRGGVISGHVTDEYGFAAVGVQVQALQYRYENGRRRLLLAAAALSATRTDDLGAYRLYGLAPGQYYVSAPSNSARVFSMVKEAAGPVTTYYPNTVDAGAAQRIRVAAGKETAGTNITLVTGRLARLRGRAVTSTGEPFASAILTLSRSDHTGTSSTSGGTVRGDGSFEVSSVPAGTYWLSVRASNARDDSDSDVARVRLAVAGEDIDDIMLVGARGATLRGTIITDEGGAVPFKPGQVNVQIMMAPEDRSGISRPPRVNEDYSFEIEGLFGAGRIHAFYRGGPAPDPRLGTPPPADALWAVKAVLWRGEDISERFVEFEPNRIIDGVEIVFSRRWSELKGTITDGGGKPVSEASLLLFPADDKAWTPESRSIRLTRSGADGVYRLPRMFAGDFLVAIVPTLEPGQQQDPDFLRTLVDRATRVSLTDGETKTLDLRVATSQ